jgi:hypothetical protein
MNEDEICGETKNNGEPCTYTAKYEDGKCGIHSDENDRTPAGGRPSKLEEHKDDILTGARQGMTKEGCARLAGVTEQTLHNWLNEDDEFFESFNRARAQGELQHLQSVNDSGSRFILERSYGYTKTEKRELEHTGDGLELVADFTPDE